MRKDGEETNEWNDDTCPFPFPFVSNYKLFPFIGVKKWKQCYEWKFDEIFEKGKQKKKQSLAIVTELLTFYND